MFEFTPALCVVWVDNDMPDLARGSARAVVDLAPQDEPAPDAGADPEPEQVVAAFAGAKALLGEGRGVDVVVEHDGHVEAALEFLGCWQVVPLQIRCIEDDPPLRIDRAGGRQSNGVQFWTR